MNEQNSSGYSRITHDTSVNHVADT